LCPYRLSHEAGDCATLVSGALALLGLLSAAADPTAPAAVQAAGQELSVHLLDAKLTRCVQGGWGWAGAQVGKQVSLAGPPPIEHGGPLVHPLPLPSSVGTVHTLTPTPAHTE